MGFVPARAWPEFRSGARSRREPEGRDPAPEPVEPGGLPGSSNRSPYDDGWPMPAHFIPVASASGSVNRNIHPPEGKPKPERKIVLSKKSPLLDAAVPECPPRASVSDYPAALQRSPRNQAAPAEGKNFKRCVSITSSDAKGAIEPPVWVAAKVVLCECLTRRPAGRACVTARLGCVAMTRRQRRRGRAAMHAAGYADVGSGKKCPEENDLVMGRPQE